MTCTFGWQWCNHEFCRALRAFRCGIHIICCDNYLCSLFRLSQVSFQFVCAYPVNACCYCISFQLTSPWSSGKCVSFDTGRSRVSAGSCQDLLNWYCSLLKAASHRIRLRLTIRLMANGSLHTSSVGRIPVNFLGFDRLPAYLKLF